MGSQVDPKAKLKRIKRNIANFTLYLQRMIQKHSTYISQLAKVTYSPVINKK